MSHTISTKVFTKISELDEAVGFNTADEFVVVNDAITQKITGYNLTESIVSMGNLATKAYVDAVVDGAPELLDTLNELAAALNDDQNFATNIITSINSKLSTDNFGLEFWNALTGVTTFHIPEDTNLYYTQARFDAALAAKTTTNLTEGSNLYFTEQRVLDVMSSQPADRLISGNKTVILDAAGTLTLPSPTSDMLTLTFASTNYVATESKPTLTLTDTPWELHGQYTYAPDGRTEIMLDNIWPNPVNPGYTSGDTFTFDESVHGIAGFILTIALNSVVLPGGAGWTANVAVSEPPVYASTINSFGAIKLTSNNNSWIFCTDGALILPTNPTSDNHAATKGYVDNQVDTVVAGQGFATLGYVEDAIGAAISTARTAITSEISTEISTARTAITSEIGTAISTAELDGGEF